MAAIAQKTQAQIVALARGVFKSPGGITDARLIEWLDIWLGRLAEHKEWEALYQETTIDTVIGTATPYSLPDGSGADPRVHKLFRVFLDHASYGGPLKWEAPTLFDERHQVEILLDSTSGVPNYYTIRDFTMAVFPIPDAEYPLRVCYNRPPDSMADGTSKCEIYGIDDALICFLISMGYQDLGEDVKAMKYEQMAWQRIDGTRTELVSDVPCVRPYIAGA